MYTDCTKEELANILTSKNDFIAVCSGQYEVQCTYGCTKCFPIYKLCVYELYHHGNLMHFPSGAHLKNCTHIE